MKMALITGASSGIGREIALLLAARGYGLILTARREDRLQALAQKIQAEYKVDTVVLAADLADRAACKALHERAARYDVEVLINNAGFGACGDFAGLPLDNELAMLDTNVAAVHILTKLFLRDFVRKDRGYILNVASSAGLMPGGPWMATYYATKAYVLSLTRAVAQELAEKKSRVRVCALCPGPVDTEFNAVAKVKFSMKGISSARCAKIAVEGLFKGKRVILPGMPIAALPVAIHLLPANFLVKCSGRVQKQKLK